MDTNIINQTEFNSTIEIDQDLSSEHATQLDKKIKSLNSLNFTSKSLNSKTNEINKIVNSKDSAFSSINEIKHDKTQIKNSSNLTKLLVNNRTKDRNISMSSSNIINEANYFSIGNKHMNLNLFKNFINNFNTSIDQIKNNTSQSNINSLRHYLNLLTKFELKLANSNYNLYRFNKTSQFLFAMQKATNFLNLSFNSKGCIISKPVFNLIYTSNKIEKEINNNLSSNSTAPKIAINLFYYIKTTELLVDSLSLERNAKVLTDQFESKFSNLSDYLTNLFNAEVELNLVRLYQPYQDSNILVYYLNTESYNNKFIRLISSLFKNINITNGKKSDFVTESNLLNNTSDSPYSYPSNVSGINVKLAGRALNERVIPRLTVKRAQRGSFNRLNAKLIEKSMLTDKTRKGAFTFTVTLSQNFK